MAELVTEDGRPGADMVQVAFATDAVEGEMIQGLLDGGGIACLLRPAGINGPMLGFGLLPRSGQRVMVRPDRAEAARRLLYENLFANEQSAIGEAIDPDYLGLSSGRKPRNYGLLGGYARASAWSFAAMAIIFAVFLLLRSF
jgi:hypothetical protein